MSQYKRYTKPTQLVTYSLYKYYRDKNRPKEKTGETHIITDYGKFTKVAYALLREIGNQFINNTYGIVLDKFGYLCIWRTPFKKILKQNHKIKGFKIVANYHTDGYFYSPTIFTDAISREPFRGWSLDRTFTHSIKQAIYKNLFKGVKYKFDLSLVKSFYNAHRHNNS